MFLRLFNLKFPLQNQYNTRLSHNWQALRSVRCLHVIYDRLTRAFHIVRCILVVYSAHTLLLHSVRCIRVVYVAHALHRVRCFRVGYVYLILPNR